MTMDYATALERVKALPEPLLREVLASLGDRPWREIAHTGQIPPDDWRTWYVRGGRGSGKTWTGANVLAEMAQEVTLVARLAWRKVAEGLQAGTFEPRDAIFAAEKATAAMQLLTGGATARVETVTEGMNDHEREALREVLADAIAAKAAQPA